MGVSCEPHFLVKSIFVLFLRYFRFFSLFTRFPAHTCAARSTLPYSLWLPFVRRRLQEDANAPTLYASRVTPLPSGPRDLAAWGRGGPFFPELAASPDLAGPRPRHESRLAA